MNAAVVVGIAFSVLLLTLLVTYNGLIHLRQEIRLAWTRLDDQLKRRYELVSILVPLVQTVGGDLGTKIPPIVSAKNKAAVAFNPDQLAIAEAELSVAIRELLLSIETDASLKSEPKISSIYGKFVANQKQIDQACRRYNEKVDVLNSTMMSFPQVITARTIGLQLQPLFNLRG